MYDSGHVDIDKSEIRENDLFEILKRTKEFSPSKIAKNVNLCQRIYNYFRNYENRLSEEEAPIAKKMGIADLIKSVDFNQSFEDNFLNLFSKELEENLKTEKKTTYTQALLAILLNKDINFKRSVCQGASNDETVYLLMAYHELMQKKQEENKHFKLKDLLEDDSTFEQMKKKVSDDSELKRRFEFFKVELGNGDWYDSGTFLLKKHFENLVKDISKRLDKAKKFEIVHKVIDRNFASVNINTVDKAVDANLFSVYLILSASDEGKLVDKIDILSCRKKDGGYKKIKELEKAERLYGLTLIKKNKLPKYDFVKYSTATRVGVLDRNSSFLDFKKELMQDIAKIISVEGGNWKIGLSTLRITPSKYSFGLLDEEVTSLTNIETQAKNLQMATLIAQLARDHIVDTEKAVVATFDKNVDLLEIINQHSVLELIRHEGISFSTENKGILSSADLKEALFTELRPVDIKDFKELAITISRGSTKKNDLIEIFKKALLKKYRLDGKEVTLTNEATERFATELFDALEAVSTLWEE